VYALDTNSVSYFLKGRGRVGQRLLAEPPSNVSVPSVVLYELEYGAARSQAPADLKGRLDDLLRLLRVLPFGETEARAAARIRSKLESEGRPIGPMDVLVAATVLEHQAVLVTRNTKEFQCVPGLQLEDWY
jgi:tRNA(fMet)-specific endonuclease VapC